MLEKILTKEEKKIYIDNCFVIYGCVPHDINWAMNTQVYQKHINKNKYLKNKMLLSFNG